MHAIIKDLTAVRLLFVCESLFFSPIMERKPRVFQSASDSPRNFKFLSIFQSFRYLKLFSLLLLFLIIQLYLIKLVFVALFSFTIPLSEFQLSSILVLSNFDPIFLDYFTFCKDTFNKK